MKYYLPDYEINIEDTEVVFYCECEDFEASYPLTFLMELYKINKIFELFIAPSIVPN